MRQILIKLSDGTLAYSRPCAPVNEGEAEQDYLDRVARETLDKLKRGGQPGFDAAQVVAYVAEELIPDARDNALMWKYREAWDWTTPKPEIDIDMPKARDIALRHLRRKRDAELSRLDVEEMKAADNAEILARVRSKKQALRDMPVTVQPLLDAAASIADLEKVALP